MTTENLGIVFAPNLLRAPNSTEMNVMDLQVRFACFWSLYDYSYCVYVLCLCFVFVFVLFFVLILLFFVFCVFVFSVVRDVFFVFLACTQVFVCSVALACYCVFCTLHVACYGNCLHACYSLHPNPPPLFFCLQNTNYDDCAGPLRPLLS